MIKIGLHAKAGLIGGDRIECRVSGGVVRTLIRAFISTPLSRYIPGADCMYGGDSPMQMGQGRVVLFATNPAYRWQNLGEFNMLANSILNFNHYPKPTPSPAATANTGAGQ